MALSEHEQQVIEQLERGLHQDPVFVHRVRLKNALLSDRRHVGLSVFGFAVGLVLMLTFCLTTSLVVGVASFFVTLISLDTLWTKTHPMIEGGSG